MAFVAQIALHVVPFAILLFILDRFWSAHPRFRRITLAIIAASAVEALF